MPIRGSVKSQAIKATLAAMPELVRSELGDAVRTTASEVKRNAIAAVPVGTGTLKNHIDFSFSPTYCRAKVGITPGNVVIQRRVYRASHYAHLVEFGARGGQMPAQPFMGPAFEGQQSALESRMRAAQRASIDDVANIGSTFL